MTEDSRIDRELVEVHEPEPVDERAHGHNRVARQAHVHNRVSLLVIVVLVVAVNAHQHGLRLVNVNAILIDPASG